MREYDALSMRAVVSSPSKEEAIAVVYGKWHWYALANYGALAKRNGIEDRKLVVGCRSTMQFERLTLGSQKTRHSSESRIAFGLKTKQFVLCRHLWMPAFTLPLGRFLKRKHHGVRSATCLLSAFSHDRFRT